MLKLRITSDENVTNYNLLKFTQFSATLYFYLCYFNNY